MSALELGLGATMVAALVLYFLLGGADFGGGVWDLLAWGPRRQAQRQVIEHAIGVDVEVNTHARRAEFDAVVTEVDDDGTAANQRVSGGEQAKQCARL